MTVVQCAAVPALRSPIVVVAFGGWGDAADAATMALDALGNELSATPFASIDPDDFYDFAETRPRVFLDENGLRDIEWPVATFSFGLRPQAPNDVVLLRAVEPQLRWKSYSAGIVDFLRALDVSLVVSLGSLLADVAHTRPVRVTGYASSANLRATLEAAHVVQTHYEGPTGILGVLHRAAHNRSIPSMSLWAAAPHYIASASNPVVALALIERLCTVTGWSMDLPTLRAEASEFQIAVDSVIQLNQEAAEYVRQLEDAANDENADESQPAPSGDGLLRDLEEFLRRGRELE